MNLQPQEVTTFYRDDGSKRVIRDSHLPQDSIQELLGLYRDKRISSKNQGTTKEPGASENSSSGVKQVLADTSRQNKNYSRKENVS